MCQKKIMRKRSSEHLSGEPPKKRNSPCGNILSTQILPGEIFTDLAGKQWRLGKAIGHGGFGQIYLASDNVKQPVKNNAKYVVKVENHSNGPLFVEINCLLRIGKLQMIQEWMTEHRINLLGMPHYIASGSHTLNKQKLRFLIIPRYEQDLEKIFLSKNKKFNLKTVILICIHILDVLEYIHSKGYVHSDIKASNILYFSLKTPVSNKINNEIGILKTDIRLNTPTKIKRNLRQMQRINYDELNSHWEEIEFSKTRLRNVQRINYDEDNDYSEEDTTSEYEISAAPITQSKMKENKCNQVVLVDYGLATKYLQSDGFHKQFCNDERKAHAGTIQFCSIDAHLGATSRRSDLESLGYNMIFWLTSSLPWENDIQNPETVQSKKENCLNKLSIFLKSSFSNECPTFVYEYFKYIKSLSFEAKPDYRYCKKLFQSALKEYGYKDDGKFDFNNSEGWGHKPKYLKKNFDSMCMKNSPKSGRIPLTSNIIVEKPKLRTKSGKKKSRKMLNWSKIPDPEEILRKNKNQEIAKTRERKLTESSDSSFNGNSLHNLDIKSLNPTYAMLQVFYKCRDKNANYNGLHKNSKGGDRKYLVKNCTNYNLRETMGHKITALMVQHNGVIRLLLEDTMFRVGTERRVYTSNELNFDKNESKTHRRVRARD